MEGVKSLAPLPMLRRICVTCLAPISLGLVLVACGGDDPGPDVVSDVAGDGDDGGAVDIDADSAVDGGADGSDDSEPDGAPDASDASPDDDTEDVSDTSSEGPPDDGSDAPPDDAPPDDAPPDDASPDDASPDDASPDDASPDDASPDDASPDDASPDDASPGDASPADGSPGDTTDASGADAVVDDSDAAVDVPDSDGGDTATCDADCSGLPGVVAAECVSDACVIVTCADRHDDCDDEIGNGCETAVTTNADCGGCDVLCAPSNAVGECSTGVCRVVACTRSDYDDCDDIAANGCESSLRTRSDCGACDVPCELAGGAESCASGSCLPTGCATGLGDCDGVGGCETQLNTNTHCGDCFELCAPFNATGSCSTGTCVIVSCNLGWDDVDGRVTNGCEAAL